MPEKKWFEKLSSIYFNHEWRISDFTENSVIHLFLGSLSVSILMCYADDLRDEILAAGSLNLNERVHILW